MQPYQDFWPGGVGVEVWPELDSTNSELMRRARAGRQEPVLLVAETQTAGRGRLGRQWHNATAAVGSGLSFSLGLPLPHGDLTGLSLAVGVMLAQALHEALQIKWPNDLWWQQRKLAGILIESPLPSAPTADTQAVPRYVVIGVGVNVAMVQAADLRTPPAAVQEWWPQASAPELLLRIAPALVAGLQRYAHQGWPAFAADYAQRCCLQGKAVACSDGVQGVVLGVDDAGALRLQTTDGEQRVVAGEVSVRPLPEHKE